MWGEKPFSQMGIDCFIVEDAARRLEIWVETWENVGSQLH